MTASSAAPVLLLLGLLLAPSPLRAQGEAARFGITLGGISTIGFLVEYEDGRGSTELNIGTWAFRDLSISVVRRYRFGADAVRPTVGLGLWGVLAFPREGRTSAALVLRAPIGAEWDLGRGGTNFMNLDLNVNRGLWVRRSDPDDELPLNRRLVPLPGIAYRWRNN